MYYLLSYAADYKTYLYKSSDGIRFSKVETFNIPYCCDSQNQICYNPIVGTWGIYLRSWYMSTNPNISYNHTDRLYRAVSLLETSTPELIDMPLSATPMWLWGEDSGIPPALSDELPKVMFNTSNDDYDIYNSCIHFYHDGSIISYPIIYWHLPEPPQGGVEYNDGYGKLGMWSSRDGRNFEIVTNNYMDPGNFWIEFALGHVETDEMLIHYYVKFHKTHGDWILDNNSQIVARIHNK